MRGLVALAQRRRDGEDVVLSDAQLAALRRYQAATRALHAALLRLDTLLRVFSYAEL